MANPDHILRFNVPEGAPTYSNSNDLALAVGLRHKIILTAITRLRASMPEVAARNFTPGSFTCSQNDVDFRVEYMTQVGYMLLVMGFNHKVTNAAKVAFVVECEGQQRELAAYRALEKR